MGLKDVFLSICLQYFFFFYFISKQTVNAVAAVKYKYFKNSHKES